MKWNSEDTLDYNLIHIKVEYYLFKINKASELVENENSKMS